MEYIRPQDLAYIQNKYHDTAKPFDPFHRFLRRDEIFSPESGMAGKEILAGILREDEALRALSHPIRKAKALAFVLKNTRISCDPRDRFPAINMVDRPLSATLVRQWKREVFSERIPAVEAARAQLEQEGAVTILPDYDHSAPDWDRILSLGFRGLLQESEAARAAHTLTAEQDAFFEGIRITYEAILALIVRLADLAERSAPGEPCSRMAVALRHIGQHAPGTLYEALLVSYLYFMICEHIEGLQVRSLGNLDRLLVPFYRQDLRRGVSDRELRTELAYYLLQFSAIGNYWNQPLYLGGEAEDGSTLFNEFSYLLLDVYDKMGLYNPKIQIKVSASTPEALVRRALDMIRHGHNSIVFVSDATIRRALIRAGATEEQARTCDVRGCYEYSVRGAYWSDMNYLNLMKPLEYALHQGCDGVTGERVGLPAPACGELADFGSLLAEYKRQLRHLIDRTVETVNGFEDYLHVINPQSMLSATLRSCLESGRDALHGGAVANGTMLSCGFLADAVDSLTMIRKYVYERGSLTLPALVAMLDANFEGNGLWRARLRADRDKYGNNRELPDALAAELVRFVCASVVGRPNAVGRGGRWSCGFHVARMSWTQGRVTAASANGRLRGEELSKNISATMGQCREGATAAILSACRIDATAFTGDASLDLGLLPSAVQGEEGLDAMQGLLRTFCQLGGHALHINVFDADILREAQAHPDKYQDLQIRVCGWNVLWRNMSPEEQEGFIRQAEALA